MTLFGAKANSGLRGEVDRALLKLARDGVLVMGCLDGEPTFKVSKEFAEFIKGSALALQNAKGDTKDFLWETAILALVKWYTVHTNGLEEREAFRLVQALMEVLSAHLEGGP